MTPEISMAQYTLYSRCLLSNCYDIDDSKSARGRFNEDVMLFFRKNDNSKKHRKVNTAPILGTV